MNLIGPLNSGAAAGGAGTATASSTTSVAVSGILHGLYIRYNDSPPATTDVTIATAADSAGDPPSLTILTVTDAATSGWFFPHLHGHDTDASVPAPGADAIRVKPPVYDNLKITIAQANNGDSIDVWFLVSNGI